MLGTFFPPPRVSDPDMHYGTCVTHVPWCMPGSLTSGFFWSRWRGKRFQHSRRVRTRNFTYLLRPVRICSVSLALHYGEIRVCRVLWLFSTWQKRLLTKYVYLYKICLEYFLSSMFLCVLCVCYLVKFVAFLSCTFICVVVCYLFINNCCKLVFVNVCKIIFGT